MKSGSVKDGQIVDARVAGAAAPDDHGLVGKLVPAVDLHVRDAVVADLEVSHRAEDGDEDDHEGGVAEPDRGGQAALMLHSSINPQRQSSHSPSSNQPNDLYMTCLRKDLHLGVSIAQLLAYLLPDLAAPSLNLGS